MKDACTYLIQLGSEVDEGEFNFASPLRVTAEANDPGVTQLTVCCDQSGLIGLLRHFHGLGFELLSVRLAGPADPLPPVLSAGPEILR